MEVWVRQDPLVSSALIVRYVAMEFFGERGRTHWLVLGRCMQGFAEKITGIKEQVKGKVTHNPDLVAKSHDRMTRELKHKDLEEDAKADPFADPEEKKAKAEGADATPAADSATTTGTTGGARTKADV
ncbi:hypothetical protein B0H14DRAFT_3694880 [Mycena olivaceomarginata]|nr:hypothetical protein B0H14DRAFT_3694880 [Mycena olivaceomarginata]